MCLSFGPYKWSLWDIGGGGGGGGGMLYVLWLHRYVTLMAMQSRSMVKQ